MLLNGGLSDQGFPTPCTVRSHHLSSFGVRFILCNGLHQREKVNTPSRKDYGYKVAKIMRHSHSLFVMDACYSTGSS